MNLARISVNNSVTVNTVMITVIVLGIMSLSKLPREYLPDLTFNMAIIVTTYPGTSPEDIEKLITIPIEDEIMDIDNIDFIMSKSSEGHSSIFIRFEDMSESDFKVIMQDLRSAVNETRDLPEDADDPNILEIETGELLPALQVTITGDLQETTLKELSDEFRDRLLEINHIGKVELTGIREREIWVNIDPDRLYSYGLSIEQVAQALQATNFNMPGGTLEAGGSEYLIRTMGEYDRPQAIQNVIVRSDPEGKHVKIGHIAQVKDTFERIRSLSFFNRKPGVSFNISKKRSGSTIAIVDQIKELAREFEDTRLPPGSRVLITNDSSIQIRDAIRKLGRNAIMGTIFVMTLLCLSVGWRNALFAGIGIPVSIMCTFIFMNIAGESVNTSSLFALMMVIGIIVDDAIIIIENCYRYIHMGLKPREAAIAGTTEVMGPVFTACLTTTAAFFPLMLLPDIIGKFLRVVPVIVCLALTASLCEAFLILPSHIAEWSGRGKKSHVRERVINRLRNIYTRKLTFVLKRRYIFVTAVFTTFLGCVLLIRFGIIDVDMYSADEISQFYVNVKMPEGTNLKNTNNVLTEIERRLVTTLPKHEVEAFVTNAGLVITDDEWIFSTSVGHIMVDLVDKYKRERSIDDIIRQCRKNLQSVAGPSSTEFRKLRAGPPISRDIEVKVVGKFLPKIKKASEEIKTRLSLIPGVYDISDDLNFGKKELKIYIDEDKAALYGLDLLRIASAIRNAYEGKVATVFREGDEEIDVVVKYDPEKVKNIDDIENIKIMNPQGKLILFRNLGSIKLEPGYTKIRHFKLDRAATVTASVDKRLNSTAKANLELQKTAQDIIKKYPGCRLRFEGAFREMREAFSSLGQLFVLGIFFIYVILGAQFKSYTQPFIILLTIPFAFIGAIIALIFTNNPFSIVVLYGFVGLAGIAVNDAIVMISFINNARRRGADRWRSIIESGRLRLRPIILTSITTMFGVLPLAIGLGGKSAIWAPMANTILWGLGFATMLTLFILPSVYTIIVDDIGGWWEKLWE
jgi:multidrug efflux pump subunit AcrB